MGRYVIKEGSIHIYCIYFKFKGRCTYREVHVQYVESSYDSTGGLFCPFQNPVKLDTFRPSALLIMHYVLYSYQAISGVVVSFPQEPGDQLQAEIDMYMYM